ncbi:hypothetical protein [Rugamonas rubra]|uniref:hypothetical protein n=1 Tax=Rugamonas rubra TaxID=758825 RepID=UPI001113F4F2|nr:hypothetical protein [Rugamonas rubra]
MKESVSGEQRIGVFYDKLNNLIESVRYADARPAPDSSAATAWALQRRPCRRHAPRSAGSWPGALGIAPP